MFSLLLINNCECSIQIINNKTLNRTLIVNNWSSHKILVERLASSVLFANYFNLYMTRDIPSAKEEKKKNLVRPNWSHPFPFSNRSRVVSLEFRGNEVRTCEICVCRVQCDFSTLHPICLPNSKFNAWIKIFIIFTLNHWK